MGSRKNVNVRLLKNKEATEVIETFRFFQTNLCLRKPEVIT